MKDGESEILLKIKTF